MLIFEIDSKVKISFQVKKYAVQIKKGKKKNKKKQEKKTRRQKIISSFQILKSIESEIDLRKLFIAVLTLFVDKTYDQLPSKISSTIYRASESPWSVISNSICGVVLNVATVVMI